MIEIKNVNKVFYQGSKEILALKDINLHIAKGTIFGVIGSSGAGKSTLIRCVNMLEAPTSGSIIVDGIDLTKLSKKQLVETRRNIGMIFQHFNLLSSRTVFDNVALPLELAGKDKSQITTKVTELLKLVGLADKHESYPSNLSGGQKQRVAIARTLLKKPAILIFDEATSALDSKTERAFQEELLNLAKNRTTLIVAHRLSTIIHADQILVMDHGQIVERGTHAQLLAANGKYAEMWQMQERAAVD